MGPALGSASALALSMNSSANKALIPTRSKLPPKANVLRVNPSQRNLSAQPRKTTRRSRRQRTSHRRPKPRTRHRQPRRPNNRRGHHHQRQSVRRHPITQTQLRLPIRPPIRRVRNNPLRLPATITHSQFHRAFNPRDKRKTVPNAAKVAWLCSSTSADMRQKLSMEHSPA